MKHSTGPTKRRAFLLSPKEKISVIVEIWK